MIGWLFIIIIITPLIIWFLGMKRIYKEMSEKINAEYKSKLSQLDNTIREIMKSDDSSVNRLRLVHNYKHSARNLYVRYERDNKDATFSNEKTINIHILKEAINYLDNAIEMCDPMIRREKAIDDLLDEL